MKLGKGNEDVVRKVGEFSLADVGDVAIKVRKHKEDSEGHPTIDTLSRGNDMLARVIKDKIDLTDGQVKNSVAVIEATVDTLKKQRKENKELKAENYKLEKYEEKYESMLDRMKVLSVYIVEETDFEVVGADDTIEDAVDAAMHIIESQEEKIKELEKEVERVKNDNLKVGDKVRVSDDIPHEDFVRSIYVSHKMSKMKGDILTIRGFRGDGFRVEENEWIWNSGMVDKIELADDVEREEPKAQEINVGDRVKVKDSLTQGDVIDNIYVNEDMSGMGGEILKVVEKVDYDRFHLEGSPWVWSYDMLEEIGEDDKSKGFGASEDTLHIEAGTKVVVREDIKEGMAGDLYVSELMAKMAGETLTVREARKGSDDRFYVFENSFVWSKDIVKPADKSSYTIVVNEDAVIDGEISRMPIDKPKIPPFVADHIEDNMDVPLVEFLDEILNGDVKNVTDWVHLGNSRLAEVRISDIAIAALAGYDVVEPKFYILDKHRQAMLVRNENGDIEPTLEINPFYERDESYMFTEEEILDYDWRYWSFREEV